jgi:hypothetical protein
MSNTKKAPATRPSLNRKVTRSSQAARKKALNEKLAIRVDGTVYTLRVGDMTALDDHALRTQYGMPFEGMVQAMAAGDRALDLMAAIIWMARRTNGEELLTYAEVAAEIGFDVDISDVAEDEAKAEAPPEA